MNVPPGFDEDFGAASDWALEYRKHGIQVVPCANKMPALKTWKQYQGALVSQQVFDGWYGMGGQFVSLADMGMLTGTASDRILMVDLDLYKPGGEVALNWWLGILAVHNNNMELETWEQFTGGGGRQLFFRYPTGWTCANAKTDIHVDIRGQGGFAVLPPTRHASGKQYVWEEGRAPWEIGLLEAPSWLLEEIERLVREHGGGASHGPRTAGNGPQAGAQGAFDGFGNQTDGREDKMYRMVWRVVLDWSAACPIKPSDAESAQKARHEYEVYEKRTRPQRQHPADMTLTQMLDAEGRGWLTWWSKWQYAMRQWDDKVYEEARKPDRDKEDDLSAQFEQASAQAKANAKANPTTGLYERLSVRDIKAMPDPAWLVDGLIVEQSMGFIFGPPGCLKTFIALDMALSFATGQGSWWGRGVQRRGAVVYISSEGLADLKFRITAWERSHGVQADNCPFVLIRQSINFMQLDDITKLLETVQAVVDETGGPIAAVFVDTVSRVLPGTDENLQKDMTMFVAGCDNVRQRFGATVVGIHHTNKTGGMRGSTVMPGAGDFLIEVRREPGAMSGSIFAAKIKAAEDGWEQFFKVEKVDLPGIVVRTSLVVHAVDAAAPRGPSAGWPDIAVCREILQAIDDQWRKGQPWCFAPNSSRNAVNNIMRKWSLKRPVVVDILASWTAHGIIEEGDFGGKDHFKGYRKLVGI